MTIKAGDIVVINIANPKRWTDTHVQAFANLEGIVKEVKPELGDNNVLVEFLAPVVTVTQRHEAFHFLVADLTPSVPIMTHASNTTKRRRQARCNYAGLMQYVDNHGLTLVWDKPLPRGVLWSVDDGLEAFFSMDSTGINLTIEQDLITKW